MVSGSVLRAEAQEAGCVLVEDSPLLVLSEEVRGLDGLDSYLMAPGQIIWSDPNMIRFPNPASTNTLRYRWNSGRGRA